jgi:hypothetical protein
MTGLRVIYRFYAGENAKPRPPCYSKRLALVSFLRAFEALGDAGRVAFLCDGGLPEEDILHVMRQAGEVVCTGSGSSRSSYLAALKMPRKCGWQEDIFWFAEDDYLYTPDALMQLIHAANAVPEADYFALHGSIDDLYLRGECQTAQPPVWVEPLHRPGGEVRLDGRFWRRIDSTASTFGMRREALRQDERLLRLCPWSGCAWDHTSCLVAQGYEPYPWRHLFADLIVPSTPRNQRLRHAAVKIAMRVIVNLRSHRRPSQQRVLVSPAPALIAHLELPGFDNAGWHKLAAETIRWAAEAPGVTGLRGLLLDRANRPGEEYPCAPPQMTSTFRSNEPYGMAKRFSQIMDGLRSVIS